MIIEECDSNILGCDIATAEGWCGAGRLVKTEGGKEASPHSGMDGTPIVFSPERSRKSEKNELAENGQKFTILQMAYGYPHRNVTS